MGSSIAVAVHFLYDRFRDCGSTTEYVLPIWDDYVAFRRKRDARRSFTQALSQSLRTSGCGRSQVRHAGRRWQFCIAGHPEEVMQQLRDLEAQGLDGIVLLPPPTATRCVPFVERVIVQCALNSSTLVLHCDTASFFAR